jgi:hypothetical protein
LLTSGAVKLSFSANLLKDRVYFWLTNLGRFFPMSSTVMRRLRGISES